MSELPALKNLTIEEYFKELASDSIFPSAGSTAALTGAHAAALLAMVCRINIRKLHGHGPQKRNENGFWENKLDSAEKLICHLLQLAQEDGLAYLSVVNGTPGAPVQAIEVPLQIARLCEETIRNIENVLPQSYRMVRADLETALHVARGSKNAALAVARHNLPLIQNEEQTRYYADLIKSLSGLQAPSC